LVLELRNGRESPARRGASYAASSATARAVVCLVRMKAAVLDSRRSQSAIAGLVQTSLSVNTTKRFVGNRTLRHAISRRVASK